MPTAGEMRARHAERMVKNYKQSHAAVGYERISRHEGEHCQSCTMYRGLNKCTAVVAPIYPKGWCELYEVKQQRANGGRIGFAEGGSVEGPEAWGAVPVKTGEGPESWGATPVQAEKPGLIQKALEPITSYPATYMQMNREAREQMGHGVEQLASPQGALDVAKGMGNVALGGINYASSPISAGLRTVVGKPLEENLGIPKEYSEFAAGLALPGIGMTRAPKIAEAAVPTADAIRDAAVAAYKAPEVAALKFKPDALSKFGTEATDFLTSEGFDPLLSPKTFGLLQKATQVPNGAAFATAQNVQTLRRMLGKAAETPDKTERTAAQIAQRRLDDFMANIPADAVIEGDANAASKILGEARGNYAASARSGQLSEAVDKAERQVAKAGIGGNLENATRQQVDRILNSKAARGFSSEERQALEDYVSGTFTRNSLRVATKVLGGDNPLMAAIHGALAFPTSGVSLAAPLTGFALKKINNAVSARELGRLDELLRSRSPLARQAERAIKGWAEAGGRLELNHSAQNATRMAVAAEFLSNRLKAVGINSDLKELMSPFQGTVPGRADDEQQSP